MPDDVDADLNNRDACVTVITERDIAQRLSNFKYPMIDDKKLHAYIRQVKPEVPTTCAADRHPRRTLERAAGPFTTLWSGTPAEAANIDPHLTWIRPGGFECPGTEIQGRHLRGRARRSVKSGAGPDDHHCQSTTRSA